MLILGGIQVPLVVYGVLQHDYKFALICALFGYIFFNESSEGYNATSSKE